MSNSRSLTNHCRLTSLPCAHSLLPIATHIIRLHRVLCAKPDRVFRAFTDASAMSRWFHPMALPAPCITSKPRKESASKNRAILGGQGAARTREDGTVVRRGLSKKVRERLTTPNERRLAVEVLTRRVQHFTKGVFLGSRAFIDGWFEKNREVCHGRSRTERKRGAKSLGRPALRGLYAFRDVSA
jgi:hypothetical protein